ncbi:hypothetical protein ABPG75_006434 [Micractinium tetrahymenae]
MAQHPLARYLEADRGHALAWVADQLHGRQADDQLALLLLTRAQCNTEAGSGALVELVLRLMAGLAADSAAEPRQRVPTMLYGPYETNKQESPFEHCIFQVIGMQDLPASEQEEEEAMPLAKRQRTEAGEEESGEAAAAAASGRQAPMELEAAEEEAPEEEAGHAAAAGPSSPAAAAAAAAAAPAEAPPSRAERAAVAAEAQVALLLRHGMRLLLPAAAHLGLDRGVVPLLLRWSHRLQGSTALELDLHSLETVFKEHCITHHGPPRLLAELAFALLLRDATQQEIQTALRQASPYCRQLKPPILALRFKVTLDDIARQVVRLSHHCMLSDAPWAVQGTGLVGQLSDALPRSAISLTPWPPTRLRPGMVQWKFEISITARALLEGLEELFPPGKSHKFGKEHAAKLRALLASGGEVVSFLMAVLGGDGHLYRAMNGNISSHLRMGVLTGVNEDSAVLIKTLIDEEVFAKYTVLVEGRFKGGDYLTACHELVKGDPEFCKTVPAHLCRTLERWYGLLEVSVPQRKVGEFLAAEHSRSIVRLTSDDIVVHVQVDLNGRDYKFAALVGKPPHEACPPDPRCPPGEVWVTEETARALIGAPDDYKLWDKNVLSDRSEAVQRSASPAVDAWRRQKFDVLKVQGEYRADKPTGTLSPLEALLYLIRTMLMVDLRKEAQALCGVRDSEELEKLVLASHQRSVAIHIAVAASLRAAGVDVDIMAYEVHWAAQMKKMKIQLQEAMSSIVQGGPVVKLNLLKPGDKKILDFCRRVGIGQQKNVLYRMMQAADLVYYDPVLAQQRLAGLKKPRWGGNVELVLSRRAAPAGGGKVQYLRLGLTTHGSEAMKEAGIDPVLGAARLHGVTAADLTAPAGAESFAAVSSGGVNLTSQYLELCDVAIDPAAIPWAAVGSGAQEPGRAEDRLAAWMSSSIAEDIITKDNLQVYLCDPFNGILLATLRLRGKVLVQMADGLLTPPFREAEVLEVSVDSPLLPAAWVGRRLHLPLTRLTIMTGPPGVAAGSVQGAAAGFVQAARSAGRAAQAAPAQAGTGADAAQLDATARQLAAEAFEQAVPDEAQREAACTALAVAVATGADPWLQEQLEEEAVEDAEPGDEEQRLLASGSEPVWAGGSILLSPPEFAPTGTLSGAAAAAAASDLAEYRQVSRLGDTAAAEPSLGGAPLVEFEEELAISLSQQQGGP